jgi:signal peptidase I
LNSGQKSAIFYVVAIVVLLLTAYFVQTDTRRVDGTSMLPTLEGGDLVVVQPAQLSDLKVGDIIVYNNLCSTEGESVIHRVISITPQGLITKGDNNPSPDQDSGIAVGPITQQCLVGRVVFVVPYVELLAYYIDQQQLPTWVNYLPAAIILIIVAYLILGEEGKPDKQKTGGSSPKPDTSGMEAGQSSQRTP